VLRIAREGEHGTIAVWTIDRPEAKNALDSATMDALSRAIADASNDAALRAIVLTGAGDVFVSGGDLRELRGKSTRADAEMLADTGRALTDALAALDVPVIAALGGAAIGGGAELAVACDLRVADERATVAFKQTRMGVTTAWGTLPRLVSLVGTSRAARLLYTAASVSASDALAMGLVDHVGRNGACVEVALEWAREIAASAPRAVAGVKAVMRAAALAHEATRAAERAAFVETWASGDHDEAVEAFFARRAPKWSGR
jgi:enoyl-CoA hydratase